MCLHNVPDKVRQDLAYRKLFWCYKVVRVVRRGRGDAEVLSVNYPFRWRPGVNRSDSVREAPLLEFGEVRQGIHVFRNREDAVERTPSVNFHELTPGGMPDWETYKVIRVRGEAEDLLGSSATEMVFREVTLSGREYRRVTEGPQARRRRKAATRG